MKTKHKYITVTSALALFSGLAYAGETAYVQSVSPQANSVTYDDNKWFFGGSAGYLIDAEEGFFSAHFGRELSDIGGWSQSVFLEVGYSDLENDGTELNFDQISGIGGGDSFTGSSNIEATFIPITLNYKLEKNLTDKFSFYGGIGAGIALIDIDGDFNDDVEDINDSGNDSETTFFAQAFAGIVYEFNPGFEIYTGARYMFIDDYSLTTDSGADIDIDDNDDVLVEIGARFSF